MALIKTCVCAFGVMLGLTVKKERKKPIMILSSLIFLVTACLTAVRFVLELSEDDFEEEIRQGLEQKLDAMLNRQLYSRYKTAPNEEEREQARQEYLDRRGVPQSYRWTTPPWEL